MRGCLNSFVCCAVAAAVLALVVGTVAVVPIVLCVTVDVAGGESVRGQPKHREELTRCQHHVRHRRAGRYQRQSDSLMSGSRSELLVHCTRKVKQLAKVHFSANPVRLELDVSSSDKTRQPIGPS